MITTAETPSRGITPEESEAFLRDGCLLVRRLLERKWLALLEDSIDDVVESTGGGVETSGYHMHTFMWLRHDGFRRVFLESPLAH